MKVGVDYAKDFFAQNDFFLILAHANPDGDTLGSAFALCRVLRKTGKRARVFCADVIPKKYAYLYSGMEDDEFEEKFIVAVDVADIKLLGAQAAQKYEGRIDLCIDHHASNKFYAKNTLLDSKAAAACEIIYEIIEEMGVEIDAATADCIYTGLSTDTGCFRYSNTTPRTMMSAAWMMASGASAAQINRVMFETKTKAYAELEKMVLGTLEMHFDDKCALVYVTQDMLKKSSTDESDCDALTSLTRQIEGVTVGVTIRQKSELDRFKISLRTFDPIDASEICKELGGGGHPRAAGCDIKGSLSDAKELILQHIKEVI